MDDQDDRKRSTGLVVVIVLTLALLAAAAWQTGLFESGADEDTRTAYKADMVDQSGGELIVTDADTPAIEVELPQTRITPVPAREDTRPSPPKTERSE